MPYGNPEINKFVSKKMDCFQCNWKCKYGDYRCIKDITVDEMFEEVKKMITELLKMNHQNFLTIKRKYKLNISSLILTICFFLTIIIYNYILVNNPILFFIGFSSILSTWLAYYYPTITIVLLITFGQIVQFEFEKFIQSFSGLPLGNLNLRFSDPNSVWNNNYTNN